MTASNELNCFPIWPLPETAMGLLLCNCLVGALPHYVIRPFPLCGVKAIQPAQDALTRPPVAATAKKKKRKVCTEVF